MNRFLYVYSVIAYYPAVMFSWYLGWTPLLLGMALATQIAVVTWAGIRQGSTTPLAFAMGYFLTMPLFAVFSGREFYAFGLAMAPMFAVFMGMLAVTWEQRYQMRQRGQALGRG